MEKRKQYTFSMDAPECVKCPEYESCKNKRRVMCMYLEPLTNPVLADIMQPVAEDIMVKHDYRDIKIGDNTTVTIDLEEIKKKAIEDFYKSVGCPWMRTV